LIKVKAIIALISPYIAAIRLFFSKIAAKTILLSEEENSLSGIIKIFDLISAVLP